MKMEFKPPKSKRKNSEKIKSFLPLKKDKELIGIFDGYHVTISDWYAMNYIYDEGNFGKGSLSKAGATYYEKKNDIPKIIFEHQFKNESKWNKIKNFMKTLSECSLNQYQLSQNSIKVFLQIALEEKFKKSQICWSSTVNENSVEKKTSKKNHIAQLKLLDFTLDDPLVDEPFTKLVNDILDSKKIKEISQFSLEEEKVIVVNKECSNAIDFSNANVKLEKRPSLLKETLDLNLEESFFLCFALKCLKILDTNGTELTINDIWHKFNVVQSNFFQRYACYHYYRTKGWVIKSGLKFGGDFLLYKYGPLFNHASYLVKVIDSHKTLPWKEFMATNRVVETFNKDVIFCTALQKSTVLGKEFDFPNCLKNCNIQEILSRRWIPSKERNVKEEKT